VLYESDGLEIPAGVHFVMADTAKWEIHGYLNMDGIGNSPVVFTGRDGGHWDGIEFCDSCNIDSVDLNSVVIRGAEVGLSLLGVKKGFGILPLESCLIDSCHIGIYANDSRVAISNTTISNCFGGTEGGKGIKLVNCTAGQVIIDGCTITGNGTDCDYDHSGVYLVNSDPEILNCTIEDNYGSGVACFGSAPDMDTYDYPLVEAHPNNIHSNGEGTQPGSDGAEIYLASLSSPIIAYNNIWDFGTCPQGYSVYINDATPVSAEHNWWWTDEPEVSGAWDRECSQFIVVHST
jgi:hypothetical protein